VKTVLPRAAGRPDAHGNEILCHLHARTYTLKSHRFIVTYNRSVCIIRDEDGIITVVVIIIIIVVYYDDITRVVGKQLSYARITRVTHKVYNIYTMYVQCNLIFVLYLPSACVTISQRWPNNRRDSTNTF